MFTFIAFGMLLAAGEPGSHARRTFNHLRMPPHGTVHKAMLYGFFEDDWTDWTRGVQEYSHLDGIPIEKNAKVNWKKYDFRRAPGCFNFRHRIGDGCLWIADGPSWLRQIKLEQLNLYERAQPPPKIKKGPLHPPSFVLETLWRKYDQFYPEDGSGLSAQRALPSYWVLAPGCVPTSASSCKSYLIYRKTKKFEAWDSLYAWHAAATTWKVIREKENFESFDAAFLEELYFFIRKSDYFFLTESGKLYHAPSTKAGEKSRKMKALWDDAKRPIVAVIEDADRDKVWLFAKDKNPGAKVDLFFEMKDTIQTKSFEPKELAPVNVEGRAKLLLEYLPLLSLDGKK